MTPEQHDHGAGVRCQDTLHYVEALPEHRTRTQYPYTVQNRVPEFVPSFPLFFPSSLSSPLVRPRPRSTPPVRLDLPVFSSRRSKDVQNRQSVPAKSCPFQQNARQNNGLTTFHRLARFLLIVRAEAKRTEMRARIAGDTPFFGNHGKPHPGMPPGFRHGFSPARIRKKQR